MNQKVALIGHGTVGTSLYQLVQRQPGFEVAYVVVKHPEKHRSVPAYLLTGHTEKVMSDPAVYAVLEAIDDADAAYLYAKAALQAGKTYISANKKMLAQHLGELHALAERSGGTLLYEAAVGGAVPILRTLREHLAGEQITEIRGIVNGTCNFILSRMHHDDIHMEKALAEARRLGYAESDPSADVDGWDSYYKAIVLAHVAQGGVPHFKRVKWHGIAHVSLPDVREARKRGEKIKLVLALRRSDQGWTLDLRPTSLSTSDVLYHVDGVTNAIAITGGACGTLCLSGPGAGGAATASAMIGDLRNAHRAVIKALHQAVLALN